MTDSKKSETIAMTCPICHTINLTPKKRPAPTCGNPNCIREAREQGLPFVSQPIYPDLAPKDAKKRTKGKSTT